MEDVGVLGSTCKTDDDVMRPTTRHEGQSWRSASVLELKQYGGTAVACQ
jgi:hypothetical protein